MKAPDREREREETGEFRDGGRLNDALRAVLEDLAGGGLRPIEDYQRMAPGLEQEIAGIYEEAAGRGGLDPAPRHLGPYRLLMQLGRGGQATVYLAEDLRLDRQVAIKVLDAGTAADRTAFDRFRREAEITSKLDHPGICAVYETGEDRGALWIAMRYVEGESLANKISSAKERERTADTSVDIPEPADSAAKSSIGPEPEPPSGPRTWGEIARVLAFFEQAARTLHVAHEHGVVHRDIKPGNIMVTKDGYPVILDFGLAQVAGDHPTLTVTGDIMGTPAYMSPEQLADQRILLDRRTDVYSLGVSLFECLTLHRPFDAPTRDGLYQAIRTKNPTDVRELNRSVPTDLKVVLETALEKDRDRRYQTALDLAEDLRRVGAGEAIWARPIPSFERLWRWYRGHRALGTSLAAGFLCLAVGLIVSLYSLRVSDEALRLKEETVDSLLVRDLRIRASELWPRRSETIPKMTRWIEEAEGLLSRLPLHEEALSELRAHALPAGRTPSPSEERLRRGAYPELHDRLDGHRKAVRMARESVEDGEIELGALKNSMADSRAAKSSEALKRLKELEDFVRKHRKSIESQSAEIDRLMTDPHLSERLEYTFSNEEDQNRHDFLGQLVRNAHALLPLVKEIQTRAEQTREALHWTLETDEAQDAWNRCLRDVQRPESRYGRLELSPEPGLLPIGIDADSGLWEFWHQESGDRPGWEPRHDPASGAPVDSRGKATIAESTGIILVLLPGGTFRMGATSDPEGPVHDVQLMPFYLGKHEVTQAQWVKIIGSNPSARPPGWSDARGGKITGRHPVERVSWNDAREACRRWGLALPTEAQWEYACRAQTSSPWWCGDDAASIGTARAGNIADLTMKGHAEQYTSSVNDTFLHHSPVGTFAANPFGLHDVIGNVWEWCQDGYSLYRVFKHLGPRDGDRQSDQGDERERVLRGGSFRVRAEQGRSAFRDHDPPGAANYDQGLRVALPLSRPTR